MLRTVGRHCGPAGQIDVTTRRSGSRGPTTPRGGRQRSSHASDTTLPYMLARVQLGRSLFLPWVVVQLQPWLRVDLGLVGGPDLQTAVIRSTRVARAFGFGLGDPLSDDGRTGTGVESCPNWVSFPRTSRTTVSGRKTTPATRPQNQHSGAASRKAITRIQARIRLRSFWDTDEYPLGDLRLSQGGAAS